MVSRASNRRFNLALDHRHWILSCSVSGLRLHDFEHMIEAPTKEQVDDTLKPENMTDPRQIPQV